MLAARLFKLPGSEYVPKHERVETDPSKCKKGEEGIWDVLGRYDHHKKLITICDPLILKTAEELRPILGDAELKEQEVAYPLLRELVRLHEHVHAYIHTARIEGSPKVKEWFAGLPSEVGEPLTVLISYSTVKSNRRLRVIFEELDKRTPDYYRRWKDLSDVFGHTSYIVPIVKFARTKIWRDWNDFCSSILSKKEDLNAEAIASEISRHKER